MLHLLGHVKNLILLYNLSQSIFALWLFALKKCCIDPHIECINFIIFFFSYSIFHNTQLPTLVFIFIFIKSITDFTLPCLQTVENPRYTCWVSLALFRFNVFFHCHCCLWIVFFIHSFDSFVFFIHSSIHFISFVRFFSQGVLDRWLPRKSIFLSSNENEKKKIDNYKQTKKNQTEMIAKKKHSRKKMVRYYHRNLLSQQQQRMFFSRTINNMIMVCCLFLSLGSIRAIQDGDLPLFCRRSKQRTKIWEEFFSLYDLSIDLSDWWSNLEAKMDGWKFSRRDDDEH